MFSELDELSGGREGGASAQAPDDVPSFSLKTVSHQRRWDTQPPPGFSVPDATTRPSWRMVPAVPGVRDA